MKEKIYTLTREKTCARQGSNRGIHPNIWIWEEGMDDGMLGTKRNIKGDKVKVSRLIMPEIREPEGRARMRKRAMNDLVQRREVKDPPIPPYIHIGSIMDHPLGSIFTEDLIPVNVSPGLRRRGL